MTVAFPKPEPLARKRARVQRQRSQARVALHAVVVPEGAWCYAGCGRKATAMHHVKPLSLGGPDAATNLIPLCAWCHNDAHAKLVRIRRDGDRWVVARMR